MTPGAHRVLQELADDEECDIAQEGWSVYVGNRQTTCRVVSELLNLMAISITSKDGLMGSMTYYGINDIGRSLLRRPELERELVKAIYSNPREPFHVVDDRVVAL